MMRIFLIPWVYTLSLLAIVHGQQQNGGAQPPALPQQQTPTAQQGPASQFGSVGFFPLLNQHQLQYPLIQQHPFHHEFHHVPMPQPEYLQSHFQNPLGPGGFFPQHAGITQLPTHPGLHFFEHPLLYPAAFTNRDGSSREPPMNAAMVVTTPMPTQQAVPVAPTAADQPASNVVQREPSPPSANLEMSGADAELARDLASESRARSGGSNEGPVEVVAPTINEPKPTALRDEPKRKTPHHNPTSFVVPTRAAAAPQFLRVESEGLASKRFDHTSPQKAKAARRVEGNVVSPSESVELGSDEREMIEFLENEPKKRRRNGAVGDTHVRFEESHDEDAIVMTADAAVAPSVVVAKTAVVEPKKETKETSSDVDLHKLLRALDLTPDEKKEIVRHVEQLLKEEIARKILASAGTSSNNSTSSTASSEATTTPVTTIATTPSTTATTPTTSTSSTTTASTTTASTTESTTTSSTTVSTTTTEEPRTVGKLRIREQKEIRESQPRVDGAKLMGTTEYDDVPDGKESDSEQLPARPHSSGGPVQTTDRHLSFGVSEKQIEEERGLVGKIHTRKIKPVAHAVLLERAVTGAPLDLTEEETTPPTTSTTSTAATTTTTAATTTSVYQPLSVNGYLPRSRPHVRTAFERLANDYRQRLAGTDDFSRLLANFYKDAYIVLRPSNDIVYKRPGRQYRRGRA